MSDSIHLSCHPKQEKHAYDQESDKKREKKNDNGQEKRKKTNSRPKTDRVKGKHFLSLVESVCSFLFSILYSPRHVQLHPEMEIYKRKQESKKTKKGKTFFFS